MKFQAWLIGIVAAVAATSVAGLVVMYGEFKVMQGDVNELIFDEEDDDRQDVTLRKHWKIHRWTADRINELRVEQGKPLASWPELD